MRQTQRMTGIADLMMKTPSWMRMMSLSYRSFFFNKKIKNAPIRLSPPSERPRYRNQSGYQRTPKTEPQSSLPVPPRSQDQEALPQKSPPLHQESALHPHNHSLT